MPRFTPIANHVPLVMIGAALLAMAPTHTRADWAESQAAGTAAAQQGNIAKAKASFATAVHEATTAGNPDQAARSAIGLANALTHEKQHATAAGVLSVAVRLCDIQGAVEAPTAAALRDSLAAAKSGVGTLDHIERRTSKGNGAPTPDASARVGGAPTPDASARVGGAPTPDASARVARAPTPDASARVGGAPTPDASARVGGALTPDALASVARAPTPDASARVVRAPTPDASARVGSAPTPDASARVGGAPTPDASARSMLMASSSGAVGAPSAGGSKGAPTPDASARTILQDLIKAADAAK
jgi:hypothetical protein